VPEREIEFTYYKLHFPYCSFKGYLKAGGVATVYVLIGSGNSQEARSPKNSSILVVRIRIKRSVPP
jgi:hypothetical protein